MNCKKCSYELNAQAKFCPQCGEQIVAEKHCSNCAELLEEGVKFCGSCGTSITKGENVNETINIVAPNVDESEVVKEPSVPIEVEINEKKRKPDNNAPDWTLETFKTELNELGNRDIKSKSTVALFGTSVFYKHFFPLLTNGETLLAIRQIQSKLLFARYRKEFVVVTNKRVIKFEKMQYFKPKVESFYHTEIQKISSDEPGNVIAGTFVGEKVIISGCDGRQIVMRMVGKGAGQEFKKQLLDEKERYAGTLPEISSLPKAKKKRGWKKVIIGLSAVIIVLAVLAFIGGGGTGTELSEYIPLAQEDVIKFTEKNGLEEIVKDSMYSDDNLIITLNDNGNIDTLIVEGPQYSLYGMKVGNDFSLEKDGKRLTEHNYGFLGEYGDRIVYGVSGRDPLGVDRLIAITLTSDENIGKLEFMKSGAQDIIDEGNKENILSADEESEVNSMEENKVPSGYAESHVKEIQENIAIGANQGYILPDSSSRYLTNEDLSGLDKAELRLARNEIYAKHGREFETEDLNQYFNSQSWYNGYLSAEEFDDSVLNNYEKVNLDLIKNIESGLQPIEGQLVAVINIEDVWGSEYWSDGVPVTMQLGQTENGYYLQFIRRDRDNEVIWSGTPQRYANNEQGGLTIYAVGEDLFEGISNAEITIEWNSPEEIDHPNVYSVDNAVIAGAYSY